MVDNELRNLRQRDSSLLVIKVNNWKPALSPLEAPRSMS